MSADPIDGSSKATAIMVVDSEDDDDGPYTTAPSTRSSSRGKRARIDDGAAGAGSGAQSSAASRIPPNDFSSKPNVSSSTKAKDPTSSSSKASKDTSSSSAKASTPHKPNPSKPDAKNQKKEKKKKSPPASVPLHTRPYQAELLALSLRQNVIIALDTGAGKTHVAVLRVKAHVEAEGGRKLAWFLTPTVALAAQQHAVLALALPFPCALLSGAAYPDQWKDKRLWEGVLRSHKVVVSTPQILLDALRHGYVHLGRDVGLLVFDEAHHCVEKHPYRMIMGEFYFSLPVRPRAPALDAPSSSVTSEVGESAAGGVGMESGGASGSGSGMGRRHPPIPLRPTGASTAPARSQTGAAMSTWTPNVTNDNNNNDFAHVPIPPSPPPLPHARPMSAHPRLTLATPQPTPSFPAQGPTQTQAHGQTHTQAPAHTHRQAHGQTQTQGQTQPPRQPASFASSYKSWMPPLESYTSILPPLSSYASTLPPPPSYAPTPPPAAPSYASTLPPQPRSVVPGPSSTRGHSSMGYRTGVGTGSVGYTSTSTSTSTRPGSSAYIAPILGAATTYTYTGVRPGSTAPLPPGGPVPPSSVAPTPIGETTFRGETTREGETTAGANEGKNTAGGSEGKNKEVVVCRPAVLGLTASPIYGSGDVDKAFRAIESNLDALIVTPTSTRASLAQHVHRPVFKHVGFFPPPSPFSPPPAAGSSSSISSSSSSSGNVPPFGEHANARRGGGDAVPFSTNLASLQGVIAGLEIEDDPYVKGLRRQLEKLAPGGGEAGVGAGAGGVGTVERAGTEMSKEYVRVDQKLSKVLSKKDSFTHKGLRDFERAAVDILHTLGSWACDWFVWSVVERAKQAANPFAYAGGGGGVTNALGLVMRTWRNEEKRYLSQILEGVMLSPPSYYEDDIVGECSDKVRVLIEALLDEKEEAESHSSSSPSSSSLSASGQEKDDKPEPEGFSGLVFVQRRDAVLALAELLSHHPATNEAFRIGTLLGSSDSVNRHAFMDITRTIVPGERVVEEGTSRDVTRGDGNDRRERKEDEEGKEKDEVAEEMEVEEELLASTGKGKGVADEDDDMSIDDDDAEPTKKDKGKEKLKEMGRLTRKAIKGKPPVPDASSRPPKAHSAKAQQAILAEFRSGEKNLIISTAVAEEGIDIQACGCVVRWDPPQNMASWVQSRGRARRKRSTFVLLYDVEEDKAMGNVEKWRQMEEMMVAESQMRVARFQEEEGRAGADKGKNGEASPGEDGREEVGDWDEELRSEETGATINPHSAVAHLSHFCSIISRSGGEDNRPIYDIDPPDYPIAYHSSPTPRGPLNTPSYTGPWSSTVHLPRSLPIPKRAFSTLPNVYPTKLAAHRHAAFQAYKTLSEWGLLNENLLPLGTGVGLTEEEEEVKRVLEEVERREGLVGVKVQVDPWMKATDQSGNGDAYDADAVVMGSWTGRVAGDSTPTTPTGEKGERKWYVSTMEIDGLPPLLFFTLRPMEQVSREEGPELHRPGREATRVSVTPRMSSSSSGMEDGREEGERFEAVGDGEDVVKKAREYTRTVFWCFGSGRMEWENMDFAYLFLPVSSYPELATSTSTSLPPASSASTVYQTSSGSGVWADRRQTLASLQKSGAVRPFRPDMAYLLPADIYASKFSHSEDVVIVRKHVGQGRPLRFVGWQWESLGEDGEDRVREGYASKRKRKDEKEKVVLQERTNGQGVESAAGMAMDVDKTLTEAVDVVMKDARDEQEETKLEITYPLLIVESFPPRTNFLHPLPASPVTPSTSQDSAMGNVDDAKVDDLRTYLLPSMSAISFYSYEEVEYAFLLPSILRWIGNNLTVSSFRQRHWTSPSPSPLLSIPRPLLTVALTAPVSGEHYNYQRLETLGDAVLKFVVGVQLYAEYPMWHEGYLTRAKDHAVSNVKLAKECFGRGVFRWIVRDRLLGRKWAPRYASGSNGKNEVSAKDGVNGKQKGVGDEEKKDVIPSVPLLEPAGHAQGESSARAVDTSAEHKENASNPSAPPSNGKKKKKKGKGQGKKQELSTKVLADVVEALIGAAYEHGGFDLGYECAKFFDLGVKWQPLTSRLAHVQANIPPDTSIGIEIPAQIADVESMIGYTFKHKILLIEALTHASYGDNAATISYERLEFLGDSILDMIVTDYLYHAPGKTYSPGHMHIRKSAVVNGHFLAYICLGLKHTSRAVMPQPVTTDEDGELPRNPYARKIEFEQGVDEQEIYLWQCLLHSNQGVLEDQTNTFTRYEKWREVIQHALENETVFPWAALTRLQAPKFFSDIVEAVIGAVFLDCGGNMGTIKDFLRGIGILPVLERIVADDVDVFHPVSRVAMWASRNDKTVEFEFEHERGDISCVILVDGEEEVRETEKFRGKTSQEEVKYAVAEKAIKQFKLRDTGAKTGIGDKWKKAGSRPKRKRRSEE